MTGSQSAIRLEAATLSRTLNSSFQRRLSRATHQSCNRPVSVTTVSKETGTTSEEASPRAERNLHRREFLDLAAEVFDQIAGLVVLAQRPK